MQVTIFLLTSLLLMPTLTLSMNNTTIINPGMVFQKIIDTSFGTTQNIIENQVNINNQLVIWEPTASFSNQIINSISSVIPSRSTVASYAPMAAQALGNASCTLLKPRILLMAGAGLACCYIFCVNACGVDLPSSILSAEKLAQHITSHHPFIMGIKSASINAATNTIKQPLKSLSSHISKSINKREVTWLTAVASLPIAIIAIDAITSQNALSTAATSEVALQIFSEINTPKISNKTSYWLLGMTIVSGLMIGGSFLHSNEFEIASLYNLLFFLFTVAENSVLHATGTMLGNAIFN